MSDDGDDHPLGSGLSSLIRLSGVTIPSRARYVGEAVVSATMSSITLGLCCGIFSSMSPFGPLVPYLVGSTVGYGFGLWHHWTAAKQRALWYAQQYPTVMAHSLRVERQIIVPSSIVQASQKQVHQARASDTNSAEDKDASSMSLPGHTMTLEQWILQGGVSRMTWSIIAAQQCRNDVDIIVRQERQRLIDDIVSINEGEEV